MKVIFLLVLALVPGIVLLYFILSMDRNEREPLGLVLKIMLLGALSVVVAAILEISIGYLPIYDNSILVNAVVIAFVRVAWVEELCKLGVVLLFAWKHKEFTEENDGIVYVGASALGFAMLENIFYVLGYGIGTGILRALTAMPLHCFTGVLMGYYVGLAKVSPDKNTRRSNIFKGFFLAYILHGVYDALLLTRTPAAILVFPLVVWLIIFGIKFLRKGQALSLARAAAAREVAPEAAAIQTQEILASASPKNQLWKIIISRTLLTLSALFWGLVLVGLLIKLEQFKSQIADVFLGAVILSFLPILIGVILETSYRRKKKLYEELQETTAAPQFKMPPAPVPAPASTPTYTYKYPYAYETASSFEAVSFALEASPPGQMWRIVVSRTLLTISALFWALLILAFLSKIEEYGTQWFNMIIGGMVFSFFPIYIGVLLEDSYRKRKKLFNKIKEPLMKLQAASIQTGKEIPAKVLTLSPPGQLWKIII
ncbi:MAG: PrsW family intramembrane metalloprotease, partial [Candidatus Aminicenantes bacterium]|nr:PrsW family intramembrane metalloprotease [Candidatus Aminicenantes bacterium]NIM83959.1 PrsW family intramembrane metalloprotease [Candidatus Aminicenantes bacterium]NIN23428.1 PrsW family intramembrane metalloprotease [Candidatus Aminicenantes bacterium]NIN47132.1 PrsW family intramembrane metalloprotease [Candidatus Aminicenantes bacterium]NIN90056.1 PrsW family intramembrane metalloprotease [Candidatus Aminicenantes bacterium]